MILIIAEKPSVAGEIAKVVGATTRGKGYLSGNDYIVSWCVGHLIELAKPSAYGEGLEKWSLDTLPIIPENYITEVSSATADQYAVLKELMSRADVSELVEATDAGREGELIFRLVYNQAGCKKPFKRLWISSMEEKSIKEGLAGMKPGSAYDNLYEAALCRQRADWLVGINLTRLYSKMYNKTLTCGRVQTPTINLIVNRQRSIENFVPQTYFTLTANCGSFKAYSRADDQAKAQQIVEKCSGKEAYVSKAEKEEKREKPAALYDLTTLQRDANRLLGYSAQQTLDYLQKLYDNKLATYPRTDSRYITADQEQSTRSLIDTILATGIISTEVASNYSTENVTMAQIINDKKVSDHHAVLPTSGVTKEKLDNLPTGERNILLLVSYRLLSAVYAPHTYTATKVVLDIEGEPFTATGREEIDLGFKQIDDQVKKAVKAQEEKEDAPDTPENAVLPPMSEGNTFTASEVKAEPKKTKPQPSYTEDTLLKAMETAGKSIVDEELKDAMRDSGLGTPATRAGIIENMHQIVYEVLKTSLEEADAGFCTEINITLYEDGRVKITDNGRGIPLSQNEKTNQQVLDKILSGHPISSIEYAQMGDFAQGGMQVINSLCENLRINVYRDSNCYSQDYARGIAQHDVNSCEMEHSSGTEIILKPDSRIFGDVRFSTDMIKKWVEENNATGAIVCIKEQSY